MSKQMVGVCLAAAAWLAAATPATAADTRVAEAAKRQDLPGLRALVGNRADVNAPMPDGATALHWAVQWNDTEAVDLLLRARAAVNAKNDYGIAPLSLACTNRSEAIVTRLLAAGADANVTADTGETALMTCAYTGNPATVRALIQRGADVNRRERFEAQTALMWAATQGNAEVVGLLLDAGADLHARSREREHFVCFTTQCGADENERSLSGRVKRGGYSALLFASRQGDLGTVRLLLDRGAPIEEEGADGYNPLLLATHSGHLEVMRYLLSRGANPNVATPGYTPLHTAIVRGDVEEVQALIKAGANVNTPVVKAAPMERFTDKWMILPLAVIGYTPLQLAAKYVEVPILRELIAAGADPKVATVKGDVPFGPPSGTTPLMDLVGVSINRNGSTDRRGRTVDVALVTLMNQDEAGILEGAKVLVEAGVSVTAANKNGDTALHGAAGMGMRKVFDYLVQQGGDPDARNARRQSPRLIIENGDALIQ